MWCTIYKKATFSYRRFEYSCTMRQKLFGYSRLLFWTLFATFVVLIVISFSNIGNIVAILKPKETIVIGILSAEQNVCLREAQRKLFIPQARLYTKMDIKVFFVLDERTPSLDEEHRVNGDIFFLNTSVRGWGTGFAKKIHTWFKFVTTHFPDAKLVGRMDDDVFVCTPQIFDRLNEVKNELLYYGYPTGYRNTHRRDSIDDMFLFIGIELTRRVVRRNFCDVQSEKHCLQDGNAGHKFRKWIEIYEDFVLVDERANKKMIFYYKHFQNQSEYRQFITGDFCEKYLLYHKASASVIYRMNQQNGLLLHDSSRKSISEVDIDGAEKCSTYIPRNSLYRKISNYWDKYKLTSVSDADREILTRR